MKLTSLYLEDLAYWSLSNIVNSFDENIFDKTNDNYIEDYKNLEERIKRLKELKNDKKIIEFINNYKEINNILKNIILKEYFNNDIVFDKEEKALSISQEIIKNYIKR